MRCNIYSDEASTTNARYMLIGGLWVPWHCEERLADAMSEVRIRYRLTAEMKWTKVSRALLPAYRDFVDCFVADAELSFRCIVIDTQIVDYALFHRGDAELGFYKFYYQLISRNLEPDNSYWLYTDERQNRKSNRLEVLRLVVNRWWRKQADAEPLRAVEPRRSHSEDAIQLADVLLGAIAYAWNQRGGSQAKLDLVQHVAQSLLGRSDLRLATRPGTTRLSIWKWQPTGSAGRAKGRPSS